MPLSHGYQRIWFLKGYILYAIRETFVVIYTNNDVLWQFEQDMYDHVPEKAPSLPERPHGGSLDLSEVIESKCFFFLNLFQKLQIKLRLREKVYVLGISEYVMTASSVVIIYCYFNIFF